MHPLPLPFVGFLGGQENFLLLVFIIAVFSIPLVAIVGYFFTRHRREKLWHETARLALEKGQPIPSGPPSEESPRAEPPSPFLTPPPPGVSHEQWGRLRSARKREKDLKGGLALLGIGTALYVADHSLALPAFVMIGLGAALVLGALLTQNDDDFRGPPPQA